MNGAAEVHASIMKDFIMNKLMNIDSVSAEFAFNYHNGVLNTFGLGKEYEINMRSQFYNSMIAVIVLSSISPPLSSL